MKYRLVIWVVLLMLLFTYCATKKKVEYDIPSHYGPQARANAIDWFEKGKILYKVDCAGCHGIYKKGKDSVPNFTKTQIDNYNAMYIKGDPRNHSVASKLSPEQLYYILTFLRLRKVEK
jgi:mono/diheme cytochrome c family protein